MEHTQKEVALKYTETEYLHTGWYTKFYSIDLRQHAKDDQFSNVVHIKAIHSELLTNLIIKIRLEATNNQGNLLMIIIY